MTASFICNKNKMRYSNFYILWTLVYAGLENLSTSVHIILFVTCPTGSWKDFLLKFIMLHFHDPNKENLSKDFSCV